jgi:PAS domain S-box-containing protein
LLRWIYISAAVIRWEQQPATLAFLSDITERVRAEEALRESRTKFKTLFELSPEAIFVQSLDGQIRDCNLAAETMTGYSREELLRMSSIELLPPEAGHTYGQLSRQLAEQGYFRGEGTNRRRNGELYPVQVNARLLELRGEQFALVIVHDMTEQKELEKELLKVQKLESLGVLAGGIAHDFNNILSVVVGNLSLARMHMEGDGPAFGRIEEATRAALRARDLTHQLLTFSKGGAPVKETASIVDVIRESSRFALTGSNVKCEFGEASDIWPVSIDTGQINQVVSNLIINALQAMPDGGTIHVDFANLHHTTSTPSLPLEPGRYVRVSIRDRGHGIAPELLSRIFDPYFTTKKGGTGLGLATSYSIIHRHGGHIAVESHPERGTTFHIYLAASEGPCHEAEVSESQARPGSGRVLVMDDEPMILETAAEMLRFLGYEPVPAREGGEAVEMFQQAAEAGDPFSAVLMDLTVRGGMGGKEAVRRIRELDPDVPALVSSGYSNDPVMAEFEKHGFNGVVSKPYKVEQLSAALHHITSSAVCRQRRCGADHVADAGEAANE